MKNKPKRRVQAQRKFAQGAFIPPHSHTPTNVSADVSLTPVKDRNIIHNHLSAKNLLDFISLKGLHTHRSRPVVLLERLAPVKEVPSQNGHETPAKPMEPPANTEPPRSRIKLNAKNSTMCLRSRTMIPKHQYKKINLARKKLKKRLRIHKKIVLKPKRKITLTPRSDTEDERPLTYLKNNVSVPQKEAEPRVTRSTASQEKYISASETCSMYIPPKKILKELQSSKTFKEPAIPTRFNKTAAANPDTGNSSKKRNVDSTKPSTSQYYGQTGINRWLDGHKETDRKETVNDNESSATMCPSESLRTVRDVVNASASELAKRCSKCSFCQRVDLVEQISNFMQKPRRATAKDDVYEFDAERDDAQDPAPFYLHRKQRNSRNQDAQDTVNDQETTNTQDNDEHHLYLDLLRKESSPHVIQLTSAKLPNTKTGMMKARLIPKSAAHTTNEISLAENEGLLRQLLQTLQMSFHSNNSTHNVHENAVEPETPKAEQPSTSGTNNRKARAKSKTKTITTDEETPPPKAARISRNPDGAKLVEAPTFHLVEEDLLDPISFFEKIAPAAAKYGLCKIIAPQNFQPKCILNDDIKFNVSNHYIARLYTRWGPASREMSAMKAYLATQNITFNRVPLLDSLEVNLPKLYLIVQRNGGLEHVMEKKRWSRVAEEMRFKATHSEKLLDTYYVKYLVPYDTATNQERKQIMNSVEKCWYKKHNKLLAWSMNPLHHQKKLLGESDSSEEDDSDAETTTRALYEAEDCIVSGRPMNLSIFKKVAKNAMSMYIGNPSATPEEIEKEYWRLVLFATEHVCVNAASIDTAASGYGFTKNKTDPVGRHPWNLKNLSTATGNVLGSLGSVLGVTVPTLHLGMVFSTSCWHRDPHGLPWMEYMHEGPSKIWYGIPDEQSSNFRRAVEALCPTSVQNKSIWLSSDITMIPPNLLREHNVSLSRAVQNPGEYIIVFPKAYSCSISTGYTVSESVYFATQAWLKTVHQVFHELRDSCEPTMFSLEQLLIALARDPRSSLGVLQQVHTSLSSIVFEELRYRRTLVALKVQPKTFRPQVKNRKGIWNGHGEECQICRTSLYLSKVTGVLGKKSALCLLHALRLLETPKHKKNDVSNMELVICFTEKQLEEIISNLQKRMCP